MAIVTYRTLEVDVKFIWVDRNAGTHEETLLLTISQETRFYPLFDKLIVRQSDVELGGMVRSVMHKRDGFNDVIERFFPITIDKRYQQ